jgi:hypothetical protein
MMPSLGEQIAERPVTFKRVDGTTESVLVRVGRPVRGEGAGEWKCPYEIAGFGRSKVVAMSGVDSMQALLLSLQVILAELDHIAKREGATFEWLGIEGAGFPDYRLSPSYNGPK